MNELLCPTTPRAANRGADRQAEPIDVSVCVVNWNCRDVLRGCLQSLRDQPLELRFEVFVVDNGSTDGAAEMVAREFPEFVLLRNEENRGFARARSRTPTRRAGGPDASHPRWPAPPRAR